MLVLLMTAVTGAWATEPKVYDSGEVEMYSLELGDILLPGVTLTKGSYSIDVSTRANRYSVGGQIQSMGALFGIYPIVIGANGVINNKVAGAVSTTDYTPITAEGEVGNAWEVTYIDAPSYRPGYKEITIAGIKYTPAAPTGYTVSMPQDTPDATLWTAKAGTDGTYQQLPLEGVAAGTAVSVKYSGTKKVKSVKAVKKAPAGPVSYTELKGGEVLHVGDIINLSEEISFNHGDYYMGSYGSPYTVVRADLTIDEWEETVVNEKADGNYYVIKANDGGYYHFERALGVTDKSDGILVTYNGKSGKWLDYTFTVHEP